MFGLKENDPVEVSINGDTATVTIASGDTKRYDHIFIGKYSEITDTTVGVAAKVENGKKYYTFSIPKSMLTEKIYYVPRYTADYSNVDYRGKWHETSSAPYFTLNTPDDSTDPEPSEPDKPDTPTPEPAVPEDEAKSYAVPVSVTGGQMYVQEPGVNAYIAKQKDGTLAAKITLTNGYADMAAIGSKADAEGHVVDWYKNEGMETNSVFVIPVSSYNDKVGLYFRNKNTGNWSSAQYVYTFNDKIKTPSNVEVVLGPNVLKGSGNSSDSGKEDTKPEEDSKKDSDTEEGLGVKIYKDDKKTEYLMLRVTEYTAESDGKNITITFKTTHETYATKLFLGTTSQISSIDKAYERAKDGSFTITVPYSDKGKMLPLVIYTSKGWKNEQYYIQIPTNPKMTDEPVKEAETKENTDKDTYNADTSNNGSTSAQDTSTTLADGTYTPDSFSFSGGTGKLQISCTKITVRGGKTYATLHFSSKNIQYVKANGSTYYLSGQDVEIPVVLNKNMKIIVLTTAMSQPHEIEYSIYIGLAAAGAAGGGEIAIETTVGDQYEEIDETAPSIAGLAFSAETPTEKSDLNKIFQYTDEAKDTFTLIEINMVKNTAKDPEWLKAHPEAADLAEEENDAAAAGAEEAETPEEEADAEADAAATLDEQKMALYKKDVVKYLIVPEGKEVPVGLDKLVIIIQQPVDRSYASTAEEIAMLDELGLTDNIAAVGVEEADITVESVREAIEKEEIAFGGEYDNLDARELIKAEANFALESSALLPKKQSEIKKSEEMIHTIANRAVMMKMPVIIMRNDEEEDEAAAAEWYKILGAVYGAEAKAQTIYEEKLAALKN